MQVRVLLSPHYHSFSWLTPTDKDSLRYIRDALPDYIPIPLEVEGVGKDAAEDAFDLTNNPSRDEERSLKYRPNRSISVGDVVVVDDVNYVCLSMGWAVLD